ncbi:MAG TPA: HPr(Ser) kinase/phosphatase [Pyrinomonadaceae bacterium]|nr:HPr(Ser) kinase/phosphatase [Pyrinomonadaceae bacterium]
MSREAERPTITVARFVAESPRPLGLGFLAGERGAASRLLDSPRIQKLGLALAGFTHYLHAGRVQILGQSEAAYLDQLATEGRREAIARLELDKVACVLVTKRLAPPPEFVEECERVGVPVVGTPLVSSVAISAVTEYLEDLLAPREVRHGVLLDLYGLGVLLEGKSGVGKSECALDLLVRGHRLVADDMVEIRRAGQSRLTGGAPELLRELVEIRGLGILNVRELFGAAAVGGPRRVDLAIRLERWEDAGEVERLGLDARTTEILGVSIPYFVLPVSPGRNLATLVETAVRVHLLRARGYNAARELAGRHADELAGASAREGGERDEADSTGGTGGASGRGADGRGADVG